MSFSDHNWDWQLGYDRLFKIISVETWDSISVISASPTGMSYLFPAKRRICLYCRLSIIHTAGCIPIYMYVSCSSSLTTFLFHYIFTFSSSKAKHFKNLLSCPQNKIMQLFFYQLLLF